MSSQLNSANDDLVLNATGGSDLVFQQDGVEKGRVGAGGFGKVLNFTPFKDSTRASFSSVTYQLIFSFTFDKVDDNSDLLISGVIPVYNPTNNGVPLFLTIDDSNPTLGTDAFHGTGIVSAYASTHHISLSKTIEGISSGTHTVYFGWKGGTSTNLNKVNPNSSDNVNLEQTGSQIQVMEIGV